MGAACVNKSQCGYGFMTQGLSVLQPLPLQAYLRLRRRQTLLKIPLIPPTPYAHSSSTFPLAISESPLAL